MATAKKEAAKEAKNEAVKMVKVKAIASFNDLEAKKLRNPGDTWEVSEERAKLLVVKGFVKKVKK